MKYNNITDKIKDNITKRREENSSFSYNVNYAEKSIEIVFKGDKEEMEEYDEYISKIDEKRRKDTKKELTEENGIYTLKYSLKFKRLEDIEVFLRIRIIKNKSEEENILDWSEGSDDLYNLMIMLRKNNILTDTSCAGHGGGEAHIGITIDKNSEEIIQRVFTNIIGRNINFGLVNITEKLNIIFYTDNFKTIYDIFESEKKVKENYSLEEMQNSYEHKLTKYIFKILKSFPDISWYYGFYRKEDNLLEFNYASDKESIKECLGTLKNVERFSDKTETGGDENLIVKKNQFKYSNLEELYNTLVKMFG